LIEPASCGDLPGRPVVLVEGEKKACALLGLGLVGVGLPGVEMGRQVLAPTLGLLLKPWPPPAACGRICRAAATTPWPTFAPLSRPG
jgi:hypothetical protein